MVLYEIVLPSLLSGNTEIFGMILTFFLIVIPILLFWDYTNRKRKDDSAIGIPGPALYPIIGNLFMIQQRSVDDFVGFLKLFAKKYGGVVKLWFLNQLTIVVTEPKVLEVLLTSPNYIKKNSIYNFFNDWLGTGLLLSNGRKWFQRRKIITPAFHFKILEDFVEIFDEQGTIMAELCQKHCNKGAFDINRYVTLAALDIVSETALGTKINSQTNPDCEYARAVYDMSDVIMERIIKPYLKNNLVLRYLAPKLQKKQDDALQVLHSFTENIINERRKSLLKNADSTAENNYDDLGVKRKMALLDILLQSTIDGKPLTNLDIREEVDTFTFEGHDTTNAGICYTLHCLSRNPDVQAKAFAEIRDVIGDDKTKPITLQELNDLKYLELVIKETMRIHPPVPLIGRMMEEDLKIGDIVIPKGADVLIPIFIFQMDPKFFPNPEKFDPDRFSVENNLEKSNPYEYIPFSAGPRNCIGQKFAMLEMKSTVSKMLRHYEILAEGEEPIDTLSVVLRSKNGINLGLRPRIYT